MHTYCTYFDSDYLDRGLCLWRSLRRFQPRARLFVCCLDARTFEILDAARLEGVTAVPLGDVEALYPALPAAKPTRSRVEYVFTLTPSWIRYVLDTRPEAGAVTYLDSDLYFFADPQPLLDAMAAADGHVAIIGHRFPAALAHLNAYGTYNVGWVTFRRSPEAADCLHDWQRRCIDWCHDRVDGDRFADQKYLDAWPERHRGVVVLDHPGANVALWNLEPGIVRRRRGQVEVHGRPLIFYHFHGLSQIGRRTFFTSARMYGVALDRVVRRAVYGRYMAALRAAQRRLRREAVQPLVRYRHTADDVAFARRNPLAGLFLCSVLGTALP